jgi:hypothetical protein
MFVHGWAGECTDDRHSGNSQLDTIQNLKLIFGSHIWAECHVQATVYQGLREIADTAHEDSSRECEESLAVEGSNLFCLSIAFCGVKEFKIQSMAYFDVP